MKESGVNEDDEIDIMTVEKNSTFSDSDMSQEEICFLPADPTPDIPEQQDKCVGSTSKAAESNQSGSPLSDGPRQNGQVANCSSSPLEGSTLDFTLYLDHAYEFDWDKSWTTLSFFRLLQNKELLVYNLVKV